MKMVNKKFSYISYIWYRKKNKSYVIYTDYSKNEDGDLRVYVSIYDKYDEDDKLQEVTEEDELQVIDNYLQVLQEDLKSGIKLV